MKVKIIGSTIDLCYANHIITQGLSKLECQSINNDKELFGEDLNLNVKYIEMHKTNVVYAIKNKKTNNIISGKPISTVPKKYYSQFSRIKTALQKYEKKYKKWLDDNTYDSGNKKFYEKNNIKDLQIVKYLLIED